MFVIVVILTYLLVIFIFLSLFRITPLFQKNFSLLFGRAASSWGKRAVANNLYLFLFRKQDNTYSVYVKFGITSGKIKVDDFQEFIKHCGNINPNAKSSKSTNINTSYFKKELEESEIVCYHVHHIPEIEIANYMNFVSWIHIDDSLKFYKFATSLLNKYGINRNNIWDSKTSKNTVETVEDLKKFLTAIYESCGHLACAMAMKEKDFKNISCTTDITNEEPQLISLSINNSLNPYAWAFSNDNEFVHGCKNFINDYDETLTELTRLIMYKSVSYLLILSKPLLLYSLNKEQDEYNGYTTFGVVEEGDKHKISRNGRTPYQNKVIYNHLARDFVGSTWSKFYTSVGLFSNWLSDEREVRSYIDAYYPDNVMKMFEHNEEEFQRVF